MDRREREHRKLFITTALRILQTYYFGMSVEDASFLLPGLICKSTAQLAGQPVFFLKLF